MSASVLRVAHVITKLELGGAQQNTLYTLSHLNRSLFEPHLICGRGGILDRQAESLTGVTTHFIDMVREVRPWTDLQSYLQLKRLFQDLRPDIVHTHSSKAGILGRLAAAATKVPVIIHTYHGFGFHLYQKRIVFGSYLKAEQIACRRTTHLIFVSNDNMAWGARLRLNNGCSSSLIRSGITIDSFVSPKKQRSIVQALGVPAQSKVVGMIACLKPQKDPLTYVRAADIVTQRLPDTFFLLIGDGQLREAVAKEQRKIKFPDRFLHLGWRNDIPELLANFDLLVLTSLWEGLPRVIPEALLCGVPVVASDIDGNREIIVPGHNGSLAKPRSPDDFAQKIIQTLSQNQVIPVEIKSMIQMEFDINSMVRRQEELYLKLYQHHGYEKAYLTASNSDVQRV